jgi:hypothetical protein
MTMRETQTDERGILQMPTVRVVLKDPKQDVQEKVYYNAEAHISTNNILRITRGGSDSIAEFQVDAYLYWEYVEASAARS